MTLSFVQRSLLDKFDDIEYVSKTKISKTLKQNLKMSYKKLSKVNIRAFKKENITKMLQSAALLQTLRSSSTEVIYLDEFSFDTRKSKFYGWGPRNSKVFAKWFLEDQWFSFIVGLSSERYYGFLGTDQTINSDIFKTYIRALIKQIKDDSMDTNKSYLIVWDNAAIHKSEKIQKTLEEKSFGMLTIWPYWPWLNLVEPYINAIKSKLLNYQHLQK